MKKATIILIVLFICTISAGCSGDSAPEKNHTDNTVTSGTVEPSVQNSSENMRFSSINEYIDHVFGETGYDSSASDLLTYKVYADQDTLVYDYTYNIQYDNVDEIRNRIEESFEGENETAQQYIISELKRSVDIENPKIKYIYRNHDGTIIIEKTFE